MLDLNLQSKNLDSENIMTTEHINLNIQGMTCQACANRIEKVLNKKDFIANCTVNFAGETAQIEFDDTQTNIDELIKIIEKTGYQAAVQTLWQPESNSETHWRVWALLGLSLPFWIGMLGMMFGSHILMLPILLQMLIATVAQTYFALPFYKGAIASIRGGLANMDVLVSVGTLAIYLYSLGMVLARYDAHHVYFEASVMVLAFVSLGKYLEAKTKRGSLNALGSLLQLTPREVTVFKNNAWQTLSLDKIQLGDILRCVQGGRIAADGEVVSGEGWADESHLTGESQSVYKTVGDTVLAGSMLSGSLDYRAEQLGKDTLLGDMTAALADAQGSKAPIARLADKVAAVFVPTVLAISVLTLIINWLIESDFTTAIVRAVAVLVVACPCALGLATPAAIMAGMGQAVRHGVWFKNAAALEMAGSINTVVLDKTGTLTQGKPDIVDIWLTKNTTEKQLLEIASAVEQYAAHPLANAIVQAALSRDIQPLRADNVNTIAGEGISANIDGVGKVKVGKLDFCGFKLPEHLNGVWQIATVAAVSINNQLIGAFALADSLKSDSITAINRLRENHIDVHIMSGDNPATVAYIAQQLRLPESQAHGNQSPRDKAQFIQQLQQQGAKVAMVGDGINDAPALALADVGFAVRGSTDIAEQSADAVLVKQSVNQLTDGLLIARATLRVIKQNLFFAFIYNILGIPFAAIGLLTPILAGAMMAMSSISVLSNALRLKRMKF